MKSSLAHIVAFLLAGPAAHAAGYCSLMVRVMSPAGSAVEARVVVREADGHLISNSTRQGTAAFCALGTTPVSVSVGDEACNQVTVRNVPLEWNKTRTLSVIYDEAPCQIDRPPVAACAFLLRFVDLNRHPMAAVPFEALKPFPETLQADDYGRVLVRVAAGQELIGAARFTGYEPLRIDIPCTTDNIDVERVLTLRKIAP